MTTPARHFVSMAVALTMEHGSVAATAGQQDAPAVVIAALARERGDVPVARLTGAVSQALAGADERLAENALMLIVSRSTRARMAHSDGSARKRWIEERAALTAAIPSVSLKTASSDAPVRHSAVMALVALDMDPGQFPQVSLSRAMWQTLSSIYGREPSPLVRAEVVKTAALAVGGASERHSLITEALSDASGTVASQAIRGIVKLGQANDFAVVLKALDHSEREVRLAAAIGLVAFKDSARPYLPELDGKRDREVDDTVKRTLASAVASIRQR